MGERWRPVPACRWYGIPAGVFEGSSLGRAAVYGEVREGQPDKDGYLRFKHRGRWWYVHVLVCLAWHGTPQVRHLGESNQDNKPTELAWGDGKENKKDERRQKDRKRGVSVPVPPGATSVSPVTGVPWASS